MRTVKNHLHVCIVPGSITIKGYNFKCFLWIAFGWFLVIGDSQLGRFIEECAIYLIPFLLVVIAGHGDTLPPYVFVMSVEKNKGITIDNVDFKLTQYADDTTVI